MTATVVPRPPLGLPAGSIRALLALQIAVIFWMLLLTPRDDIKIPLSLYFLLPLVMMFFVAHGKSIARRDERIPSPLWLPGGTIRIVLLAGTAAVLVYVYLNHPERLNRLTPREDQLPNWKYLLGALGIGFVLGYGTRLLPFRHAWAFQSFQAWIAILAMAVLFLEMVFQVIINWSLTEQLDAVAWQTIVTAVAAFYYGSRS